MTDQRTALGLIDSESQTLKLDRLLYFWEKLGTGERNVLLTFTARLYAGQRRHGAISREKKDWTYEALEEALDGCVYLSAALEAKAAKAYFAAMSDTEKETIDAKTIQDPDEYYRLLSESADSCNTGI